MKPNIDYRAALFLSLSEAPNTMLSQSQINSIFERWDSLAASKPQNKLFNDFMELYGNELSSAAITRFESHGTALNVSRPASLVAREIQVELEKANQHKINTNSVKRVRDAVARYNKNIGKCGATLKSVFTRGAELELLQESELDALRIHTASKSEALRFEHTAFASANLHDRINGLVVTITGMSDFQ